jgi:hypothetical protein
VVSRGEKKKFSQSKTFKVNNNTDNFDFCEAFLKNVVGNYIYTIRGKNGEPKPRVLVSLEFNHRFFNKSDKK